MVLSCLPPFLLYTLVTGKYRKGFKERLGLLSPDILDGITGGTPRIWIQAVSLGEIRVAESIVSSLKSIVPECSIILSTTTEHGREMAVDIFRDNIPVFYSPIDFIGSVRKALYLIRPDVMIFLETEIWPAWINEANRMGIKVALVNGRISEKSFKKYIRLRSFFREVLDKIDCFSMIAEHDKIRIRAIGADPEKIRINGNAKYDLLSRISNPSIEKEVRDTLNINEKCPVLIAGSTRRGEEAFIIDTYKRIIKEFPDTVLLIAPRHIPRTKEIISLLDRNNFEYQLRSEINNSSKRVKQVIIINTFGELFKLYSIGSIVFCGGSIVPLGGQNPLEAAVWGNCAVFYGPHMDHFLDAKAILDENRAGVEVYNSEMFAEKALDLLRNPEILKSYAKRAREAVIKNRNAGEKHARAVVALLR